MLIIKKKIFRTFIFAFLIFSCLCQTSKAATTSLIENISTSNTYNSSTHIESTGDQVNYSGHIYTTVNGQRKNLNFRGSTTTSSSSLNSVSLKVTANQNHLPSAVDLRVNSQKINGQHPGPLANNSSNPAGQTVLPKPAKSSFLAQWLSLVKAFLLGLKR